VEGAEAPDEVDGVDADDFAGGEAGGDDVEGAAVVGVVEGGDEDEGVAMVKWRSWRGGAGHEVDGAGMGRVTSGMACPRWGRSVAEGVEAVEFRRAGGVGVGGVGFDAARMVAGATKRATSSMWPWVSSPAQPRGSQRVWWMPR